MECKIADSEVKNVEITLYVLCSFYVHFSTKLRTIILGPVMILKMVTFRSAGICAKIPQATLSESGPWLNLPITIRLVAILRYIFFFICTYMCSIGNSKYLICPP